MRVTIHQPEHFPYMGFFQKLQSAEMFVVLDDVKFRKNYFQNRNLIKDKSGNDVWVTIPVSKSAPSQLIKDITVTDDEIWRRKILRTLKDNLKIDAAHVYAYNTLVDINMASIMWAMKVFDIDVPIIRSSEITKSGSKSELLANIVKAVGAKTYISGPSGKDYLDMSFFDGIDVEFFQPQVKDYYSCLHTISEKLRQR